MKTNNIIEMLQKEADAFIPDVKQSVKSRVYFNRYKHQKQTKRKKRFAWLAAPIATLLVLAIALTMFLVPNLEGEGGGMGVPTTFTESVVRLDINPSVKFNVSKAGLVTKQMPCNKDGAFLLMKKDFVGFEIEDATVEIVNLAARFGYLVDETNRKVNLRVLNNDVEFETILMEKLNARVAAEIKIICPMVKVVASGKNDVVEFLVNFKSYTREAAEKLTAEEIEDILEDLLEDEPNANITAFETELAAGMETFLTHCASEAEKIVSLLKGLVPIDGVIKLEGQEQKKVTDFVKTFSVKTAIKNFNKPLEKEEFEDFLEDLQEDIEDAKESLQELDEDPSEISDILEDWYDRYKVYLKYFYKNA